ncbi:MAG: NFYB/HAP3 family transcription factor subunit [Nitrosopumilus sp.]|nr:NFYB/HAP3 family transcription factor subunit [Nitrosopumilus sp.]MDA7957636.1 NFYB/HAP3 family transcription factor subunit [Nitrosopumilus sp.]
MKYEVGIAAMYRILKKAGAERVSEESAAELRSVVEGAAGAIAADAVRMASHAGRKTVRAEDVRMASRDRGS